MSKRSTHFRLVLIAAWIGALSTCALADDSSAKALFHELKAGDYSDAIPKLQSIHKDSPNFVWSVQEIAKSFYKLERWSEFFGVAYFSRKALPVSRETEKIRLLEILALLRHCQPEQAKEVFTLRPYSQDQDLKKHFEVIGELLQIPASMSLNIRPEDQTKKGKGAFPAANLWPVSQIPLQKLEPYKLRRKVKALCEKKGTP